MSQHSSPTPTGLYIDFSIDLTQFTFELVKDFNRVQEPAKKFDQLNQRIGLDGEVIFSEPDPLISSPLVTAKMNFAAGVIAVNQGDYSRAVLDFNTMYNYAEMGKAEKALSNWIKEEICDGNHQALTGSIKDCMEVAHFRFTLYSPVRLWTIEELARSLGGGASEEEDQHEAAIAPPSRKPLSIAQALVQAGDVLENLIDSFVKSKDHFAASKLLGELAGIINKRADKSREEVPMSASGLLSAKMHIFRYAIEADKTERDEHKFEFYRDQPEKIARHAGCQGEFTKWREKIQEQHPDLKLD